MPPKPDASKSLGAVVLCGGQSTRLGSNKSELLLDGKTFLQTIVQTLLPVTSKVVIVGHASPPKHSLPPETIRINDETPNLGPVEGIRVGLKQLEHTCEYAFVTSCDVPLLSSPLVTFLHQQLDGQDAIIPFRGDRRYGLTAIYRTSMHTVITERIANNSLRVCDITTGFNVKNIHADDLRTADPHLDSLTNVNSPEDYQRLLDRCNKT